MLKADGTGTTAADALDDEVPGEPAEVPDNPLDEVENPIEPQREPVESPKEPVKEPQEPAVPVADAGTSLQRMEGRAVRLETD